MISPLFTKQKMFFRDVPRSKKMWGGFKGRRRIGWVRARKSWEVLHYAQDRLISPNEELWRKKNLPLATGGTALGAPAFASQTRPLLQKYSWEVNSRIWLHSYIPVCSGVRAFATPLRTGDLWSGWYFVRGIAIQCKCKKRKNAEMTAWLVCSINWSSMYLLSGERAITDVLRLFFMIN